MGEVAQAWDAQGNPIQSPASGAKQAWDANGKPITSGATSTGSSSGEGFWDQYDAATKPYTEIIPHQMPHNMQELGQEAVKGVGNIGAGLLGTVLHPINTAEGIGKFALESNPAVALYKSLHGQQTAGQEMGQQFGQHPLETTEAAIGQAGAMPILEGAIKAPIRAAQIVPKMAQAGAHILSDTTPAVTERLAADTQAANEAAQAKAAKANADIISDRAKQLQQHFEKTKAIREQNEAAQGVQSRKAALNRGVEQLDPKFKDDLSALRNSVQSKANQMYGELNAKLDPIEADSSFLPDALEAAAEKIKGSNTEPTILRDMEKRLNTASEPLTYRDLQGYYSELGRELSKGTLPGDVYHAYDTLQESIADQMQKIAGANGLGDALTAARQYYRQMKQTFFDPKAPAAKALNATEPGQAIKQYQGKDQSGVGALAQYDPELAKRANTIRGYQAEAKAIPARTVTPKPEPTLPPPTPPVLADVKKLGLKDIQEAKTASMGKRAEAAEKGIGAKIISGTMSGLAAYDLMRNILEGNLERAGMDIAARGGLAGVQYAFAKALKNPSIIRALTKPNPADIAAIPPELRAEMPKIVQAAEAQGIKVHPALAIMGRQPQQAPQPAQ